VSHTSLDAPFPTMVFEIYGARVFDVLIPNTRSSAVRGSLIRLCTRVCSFGLRLSIGASDLSITRGNERSMMVLVRACDSIAQIALACGFADFGHFSHRYKDGLRHLAARGSRKNAQQRMPKLRAMAGT
jgi:hypothetical protein